MPDTVRQVPIANDDRYHRCDSGSCSSSPAVSPSHSFKRSKSTFYLLDRRTSPPPSTRLLQSQSAVHAAGLPIYWYVAFAWKLIKTVIGWPWINMLLVQMPLCWVRLWLQAAWKCGRIPLAIMKHVLRQLFARKPTRQRGGHHTHRTVLINGGSTVQTLHLARNFYATGARVVVCEIEGRAELSSFSITVDSYYTVPAPTEDNCVQYVDALRAIVERERVGFYVATGTTVSAYYDAVAKPHLELLGCKCCAPGLDGVLVLNDLSVVFKICEVEGLSVPKNLRVCSRDDIIKLYDNVSFRAERHFIVNVGQFGYKTAHRLQLPAARKSLTLPGPVSDDCPWLLVQNDPGSYYTTCTTVMDGRVIGNVTYHDVWTDNDDNGGHGHAIQNDLIDNWVRRFVGVVSLSLSQPFDGFLTFRICVTPSRNVIPMGCRIGVPTIYTYYISNFEQIMYPPCTHQITPSPEMQIVDRYYAVELAYKTFVQMPSVQAVKRLVNTVIMKNEMLFAYWDPLPYLAHYSLQQFVVYINNILDRVILSSQKNKFTTF